jgi:hypothetical protein
VFCLVGGTAIISEVEGRCLDSKIAGASNLPTFVTSIDRSFSHPFSSDPALASPAPVQL